MEKKKSFYISSAQKSLDQVFNHLLRVFFTSSFENFVPVRISFREPDLDHQEGLAAVPNQTDQWFPLFLLQYKVLHCPGETPKQLTIEKASLSYTILFAVLSEILICLKMSFILTFLSAKINALTESTISGVSAIVYILNTNFYLL